MMRCLFIMKKITKLINYCYQTRRTWWFTAIARTKARYARTVLGSLWLGISTLFTVLCLGFVYGKVFKVNDFLNYFIYLGFGLLIWNTICDAINSAPLIFTRNASSIKNSRLPPIFFVCQEWAFQFQNFFQAFAMVSGLFFILSPSLILNLINIPLHLINFLLFIFWLPLLISILGTKYTDLFQLLPVITNLLFLLSPILYDKKNLGRLAIVADINPIYQILRLFRDSLIQGESLISVGLITFFINLVMLFFTLFLYDRAKHEIVYYL